MQRRGGVFKKADRTAPLRLSGKIKCYFFLYLF